MALIAAVLALVLVDDQVPDAMACHQKMIDFSKSAKSFTGEIEVDYNGTKSIYKVAAMRPNFLKMQSEEVNYLCDGKTIRTEFVGVSCQDFDAPKDKIEAPYLWGIEGLTNAPTILKLVPTAKRSKVDDKDFIVLSYKLPGVSGDLGTVSSRILEVTIEEATGKPVSWTVSFDGGKLSGVYRKIDTSKTLTPEDFKFGSLFRRDW